MVCFKCNPKESTLRCHANDILGCFSYEESQGSQRHWPTGHHSRTGSVLSEAVFSLLELMNYIDCSVFTNVEHHLSYGSWQ